MWMHKWQKGDVRWQGWQLWLELGRSESCGLVMLETVLGVMFGDAGFSHEDCDGFSASMCSCRSVETRS